MCNWESVETNIWTSIICIRFQEQTMELQVLVLFNLRKPTASPFVETYASSEELPREWRRECCKGRILKGPPQILVFREEYQQSL